MPPLKVDVLLVTVNKHETQAVLNAFREATGHPAKPVTVEDRVYRDLGVVNGTTVYLAFSSMGSSGPGATLQTVDKGVQALSPGAVIAVGIAFGVDDKKQSIGDVLLSKQIRLYDIQRVGKKSIVRGDKATASTRLINFFEGFAQDGWGGEEAVRPGVVLSGDKLVDNMAFRTALVKFEPEAVGGEMEGAGLFVASLDHKVDWIVIKAICDWGDGEKGKNKTARQTKAAGVAARFVSQALLQTSLPRASRRPREQNRRATSMPKSASKNPVDQWQTTRGCKDYLIRRVEVPGDKQTTRDMQALLRDCLILRPGRMDDAVRDHRLGKKQARPILIRALRLYRAEVRHLQEIHGNILKSIRRIWKECEDLGLDEDD